MAQDSSLNPQEQSAAAGENRLPPALEALAEQFGPLEVALILAPEPFTPERGLRRIPGGWALQLGVLPTRRTALSIPSTTNVDDIGDITLILTDQTATALYSFLSTILDPGPRQQRPFIQLEG